MRIQIYSQWMEDVFIPARVKQFTKAAKLSGCRNFTAYAAEAGHEASLSERAAVGRWLDRSYEQVEESVA